MDRTAAGGTQSCICSAGRGEPGGNGISVGILYMADKNHFDRLRAGVTGWNQWRTADPYVRPDLSDADLGEVDSWRMLPQ
jgi:hypothetical protein